ncbi:MAG: efflux RND transporter periplasmic adaptor subunit, partial [Candidatus Binatia bacterium]|nr:efflux RND transporter periplasmic adaptor subunit [Candidatus Binatia bacterium]
MAVQVTSVVSKTLEEQVSFVATLEPDVGTTVGAVVAGPIIESTVREGDRVVAKQTVLALVDPVSRKIALREAEASVSKSRQKWKELERGYRSEEIDQRKAEFEEQKALLSRAEQDFQRAERLYRDQLISQAEFQGFESEYFAAREKLGRARAALRLAEAGPRREEIAQAESEHREAKARYDLIAHELSKTTLFAPLTGYLVKKYVEVGTWVNPGDPVADLVDLNPIYANGPVGERKISLLKRDLPATVIVDAISGESFQGTVAQVVPRADPKSHTFPVKVRIPNSDGRLKSGMLARVSVKVGGRVGLLVPKDAVIRRGTEDFIFVVENGSARRFKIRTGRPVGGMMEIH